MNPDSAKTQPPTQLIVQQRDRVSLLQPLSSGEYLTLTVDTIPAAAIADLLLYRHTIQDEQYLHQLQLPYRSRRSIIRRQQDPRATLRGFIEPTISVTDDRIVIQYQNAADEVHDYLGIPRVDTPQTGSAPNTTVFASPEGSIAVAQHAHGYSDIIEPDASRPDGLFIAALYHSTHFPTPEPPREYRRHGLPPHPITRVDEAEIDHLRAESRIIATIHGTAINIDLKTIWPRERWHFSMFHHNHEGAHTRP